MSLSVDDALMRDFIFCSRTSDTLWETKLGRPSKGSQGMRWNDLYMIKLTRNNN